MSIRGQRATLAGLKVHDVVPHSPAVEFAGGLVGFIEQSKIDPERSISPLGPGDRLKHKVNGRALSQRVKLRDDESKNTALCRNRVAFANRIDELKQLSRAGHIVGGRIDANNRVP